MGDDFSSHQVFVGSQSADEFRRALIADLRDILSHRGYREVEDPDEADRCLAVSPAGRWICLYDSCGNGDYRDPEEFDQLALTLSRSTPIVDIHMDDSAALHLCLYMDGRKQDQFANYKGSVVPWQDEKEREAFRGKAESWSLLFSHPNDVSRLEQAWKERYADRILERTASILGWHPEFCTVGYTIDYDGISVYYKDHFHGDVEDVFGSFEPSPEEQPEEVPVGLEDFDELYFCRASA